MNGGKTVELPYFSDTEICFGVLKDLPWRVFLDSGRPRSDQGRYDILAAEPYVTLVTRDSETEIRASNRVEISKENPFQLLKRYLDGRAPPHGELPFYGGAIGYFAYDLGRRIEQLPVIAKNDISMPDMAVGLYDWAVIIDHHQQRSWLVSAGRSETTVERWDSLIEVFSRPPAAGSDKPFRVLEQVKSNLDREAYGQAFRKIKRYIREGDCYQVNLAQRFSTRIAGDPADAYIQLRALNPAPFSAFIETPDGAILSSSPERFLRLEKGIVETKPIKGTRPRSANQSSDRALADELRNSKKDRAENLMIVDLLRNDLGKSCELGSIAVPRLFAIESFATVHHLVSTVTGKLAGAEHALDLLEGCFPGGSITGAPKLRAMEIIEELEPHRRSIYCGSIAYIGFNGNMDSNIAIRTLLCNQGRIHCWAGGGIVMDSDEEDEYQESLDKAKAMLQLLTNSG